MKAKKVFQNLKFLLILNLAVLPLLSLPDNASAQTTFGNNASVAGYVKGVVPAIAKLPGCKGKTGEAIKKLFGEGKVSSFIDKITKTEDEVPTTSDLEAETAKAQAEVTGVPTYDAVTYAQLKSQGKDITTIKSHEKSQDIQLSCTNAIGRMVAKLLLQHITTNTIAWINNGYDGAPFFVQNPGQFFRDIAKEEIYNFGIEIGDESKFPFGRSFLQAQALQFKSRFDQNAQYSFNELIKKTTPNGNYESFRADFSQGGWAAWDALTQVPANNPLGFTLQASNELQKRLSGTEQSVAQETRDAIQASGGFLGDQRCADPLGAPIRAGENPYPQFIKGPDGKKIPFSNFTDWESKNRCKRIEYVTPGKLIAEKATSAIHYPENEILKAEDVNDAIAAIIDAAMSKLLDDLTTRGFADISTDGNSQQFSIDNSYGETEESDFADFYKTSGSWLAAHPDFNIRTDLTQAIIDEQRTFIEKLQLQNKELPVLIKNIHQLDYCIPGPHPGFEEDAQNELIEIENKIPDTSGLLSDAIGKLYTTLDNTLFGGLGQTLGDIVLEAITGSDGEQLASQKLYSLILAQLTGTIVKEEHLIETKTQITNILDTLLERYTKAVEDTFNPAVMPGVTGQAAAEFSKISGYQKMIENNKKDIAFRQSIVTRLLSLKERVDGVNSDLAGGKINKETYENKIADEAKIFARLSADMVTGDDVANIDNLLKLIKDREEYVYNDLLIGPAGCENDLALLPWQITDTKRMPYPFPIIYDYNNYSAGAVLPSGNKMPPAPVNNVGPGFLYYGDFWMPLSNQISPNILPTAHIHITDLLNFGNHATNTVYKFESALKIY